MKDEKEAMKKYDFLAKFYHDLRTKKYPQGWFYNEMLEMPSTLELLGNIKGKKILDFGCGTGIYAKLLTKKGAKVSGFDISPEMIKIAKLENPKLNLKVGSGYKIPFKEKFDVVLAALVIDYFQDWDVVFKQVRRVLKKDRFFIFSIGNPVAESAKKIFINGRKSRILGDYFTEKKIYNLWRNVGDKKNVKMPIYHKTYETIIKIILESKFEIVGYKDCFPLKKSKKLFPKDHGIFSKEPYFCVWKVRKK